MPKPPARHRPRMSIALPALLLVVCIGAAWVVMRAEIEPHPASEARVSKTPSSASRAAAPAATPSGSEQGPVATPASAALEVAARVDGRAITTAAVDAVVERRLALARRDPVMGDMRQLESVRREALDLLIQEALLHQPSGARPEKRSDRDDAQEEDRVLAQFGPLVPSAEEVLRTYERLRPALVTKARARINLLTVDAAGDPSEAERNAEQIAAALRRGRSVEELELDPAVVRLRSEATVTRGQLDLALDQALFGAPGEQAPGAEVLTVAGQGPVFVLQVLERIPAGVCSLDEVRGAVEAQATEALRSQRRRQLVETAESEGRISRLDAVWHRRLIRAMRWSTGGDP